MKIQKNLSNILLPIIIIFTFLNPLEVLASEKKEVYSPSSTIMIEQIEWINNNEILIVQAIITKSLPKYRIIKFKVRENQYLPLYNTKFEKDEILGLSRDGKTILIYNRSNNNMYLRRNNTIIFQKDYTSILCSYMQTKKIKDVDIWIKPIMVKNDWAIAQFTGAKKRKDTESISQNPIYISNILYINKEEQKQYISEIRSKEGGYKPNLYYPTLQENIFRKNGDIIFIAGLKAIYSITLCDFSLKKLFALPRETLFGYGSQIIKHNKKIYFTTDSSYRRFHGTNALTNKDSINDLFVYNLKSQEIRCLRRNTDYFDISNNFFVTTSSIVNPNKKDPFIRIGRIIVQNRSGKNLLSRKVDLDTKRMIPYGAELISTISPDQKRIVIFKNYCDEKPIVINTEDLKIRE